MNTIEKTLSPNEQDIALLTAGINEDAEKKGIHEPAYPFAFFIRNKGSSIIAGCNGSVVYGAIYTDQLWVSPNHRGIGLGRQLMEEVHDYGRQVGCKLATVATMSFQNAQQFYEKLGYACDFERSGYSNGAKVLFLIKKL